MWEQLHAAATVIRWAVAIWAVIWVLSLAGGLLGQLLRGYEQRRDRLEREQEQERQRARMERWRARGQRL